MNTYVDPRNFGIPNDDESNEMVMNRAKGLPLDYINTDSPYYVGAQWSFLNGGEPQFKKGREVVMTGPNGEEFTEKDLERMKR